MRTPPKLRWLLAGLALVTLGVFVLWPRPGRITRESFQWLRVGMSRPELEAILGPPGDYRTGVGERAIFDGAGKSLGWSTDRDTYELWPKPGEYLTDEGPEKWGVWISDSIEIQLTLDAFGVLPGLSAYDRRMTQGPLDNFLWRAKRQWRRWFPE
jgi:hypothetical protein